MAIGGNVSATLMRRAAEKDASGLAVPGAPEAVAELRGWLDWRAGDSDRLAYDAKLQDTTHVFVCDWEDGIASLPTGGLSLVVGGEGYEVLLADDPMGLHRHLEIYLKRVG